MSRSSDGASSSGSSGEHSSRSARSHSGIVAYDSEHHSKRLNQHRERQVTFTERSLQLSTFLSSTDEAFTVVQSLQALAEEQDIELTESEHYNASTQSNLGGMSSLMKSKIVTSKRTGPYVHSLTLQSLPDKYQSQLLSESLKILKYFASTGSSARSTTGKHYFLRVFGIFLLEPDKRVLVAEEKFNLDHTLKDRIWNTAYKGYNKVR